MAFGGSSRGVKNEINVTPLVDVVLVLLIIFMVVTPMLEQGASVTLPKAKVTDKSEKPDALTISVPADKSIWIEGQKLTGAELRSKIAASIAANSQRKLLVKGDQTLTVGAVRAVVAEAQKAGAKGISLAVEEQK
ncbi:MAG: biopolymer transporter ExbD [Polyangiales bacterium]